MSSGLPFLLIAFEEECAVNVGHILPITVKIRTIEGLAVSQGYAVISLGSPTTIVPRHEKRIIPIVFEGERCLNGIGSCKNQVFCVPLVSFYIVEST